MRQTLAALTIAIAAASPALADLTPDEVAQELKSVPRFLAVKTERRGRDIVLSDISLTAQTANHTWTITLDSLTIADLGDGRVDLRPSDRFSFLRVEAAAGGETEKSEATLTVPGAHAILSGEIGRIWIDAVAPQARGTLVGRIEATGAETGRFEATLTGLALRTEAPAASDGLVAAHLAAESGDMRLRVPDAPGPAAVTLDLAGLAVSARLSPKLLEDRNRTPGGTLLTDLRAEAFEVEVTTNDPAAGEVVFLVSLAGLAANGQFDVAAEPPGGSSPRVQGKGGMTVPAMSFRVSTAGAVPTGIPSLASGSSSGRLSDFSASGAFVVPENADALDAPDAIREGLAVDMDLAVGASDGSGEYILPGGKRLEVSNISEPGRFTFALAESGIRFGGEGGKVAFTSRLDGAEAPYSGGYDGVAFSFAMPLVRSASPRPLEFLLRLSGASASDSVWDLFDPEATIPRAPATLAVDIAGTARPKDDLVSENGGEFPLAPDRVDLRELTLRLGGAEIAGTGSVSFDNSGDVPRPDGKATLTYRGVYGLLGKLGSLGLLPPDVSMGIRGGLGFIARPVGDDDLVSDFEFRPDGTITANGLELPLR
ncbi:MAG: DUF2125 domain-containing protein [Paracoccaceae bacterium]